MNTDALSPNRTERPLHSDPEMQARCDGRCAGDECVCRECWFCKHTVPPDALIAGYDTWDEQRLACLACNERMRGDWQPDDDHYPNCHRDNSCACAGRTVKPHKDNT